MMLSVEYWEICCEIVWSKVTAPSSLWANFDFFFFDRSQLLSDQSGHLFSDWGGIHLACHSLLGDMQNLFLNRILLLFPSLVLSLIQLQNLIYRA